jgi:hypothetical protein
MNAFQYKLNVPRISGTQRPIKLLAGYGWLIKQWLFRKSKYDYRRNLKLMERIIF